MLVSSLAEVMWSVTSRPTFYSSVLLFSPFSNSHAFLLYIYLFFLTSDLSVRQG